MWGAQVDPVREAEAPKDASSPLRSDEAMRAAVQWYGWYQWVMAALLSAIWMG